MITIEPVYDKITSET